MFRINCQYENLGPLIEEIQITYVYNDRIFRLIGAPPTLEYVLPSIQYTFTIKVENIDEQGNANTLNIMLRLLGLV
jgi:hypothetical protein